jgi:hypothetical protein
MIKSLTSNSRPRPHLIDDFQAACQHLSPLGLATVGAAGLEVRQVLLSVVAAHGIRVTEHGHFTDWVKSVKSLAPVWITLDPLLSMPPSAERFIPLRVSRFRHGSDWRVGSPNEPLVVESKDGVNVGLLDDAAATGDTLRAANRELVKLRHSVSHVVVCSSTTQAKAAVLEQTPHAEWHECVSGNYATIHLRDVCAYMPFSGRPIAERSHIATPTGVVTIRVPSIAMKTGLWAHLFRDYRLLAATVQARSQVATALSRELGRDAIVADLPLLGSNVPLPAFPRQEVTANTTLISLCQ